MHHPGSTLLRMQFGSQYRRYWVSSVDGHRVQASLSHCRHRHLGPVTFVDWWAVLVARSSKEKTS